MSDFQDETFTKAKFLLEQAESQLIKLEKILHDKKSEQNCFSEIFKDLITKIHDLLTCILDKKLNRKISWKDDIDYTLLTDSDEVNNITDLISKIRNSQNHNFSTLNKFNKNLPFTGGIIFFRGAGSVKIKFKESNKEYVLKNPYQDDYAIYCVRFKVYFYRHLKRLTYDIKKILDAP